MGATQDFHLQIVIAYGPENLSDAFAVDGPAGEVAKVGKIRKTIENDLKSLNCQLRSLVHVETFKSPVAFGATRMIA